MVSRQRPGEELWTSDARNNTPNWRKCFCGCHAPEISHRERQHLSHPQYFSILNGDLWAFQVCSHLATIARERILEIERKAVSTEGSSPPPVSLSALPRFLLKARVNELRCETSNSIRSSARAWFERLERSPGYHDHSALTHLCDNL